ncbi:WecB/TagA/CpsF family glycosyltransferase [Vampirovibrio sp.]|uniref:WecB/TagA/CpsF family glycosyltransferase n=1 Tax=Vampirovibrio sp. TaxID=2717857 RepID=UPI0035948C3F
MTSSSSGSFPNSFCGSSDAHPALQPYPAVVNIEGISVTGFPNPQSLFKRIAQDTKAPGQTLVHYLNIHVANAAWMNPALKRCLQTSDLVYCDGAGIVVGAKWLGQTLPTRLTAADWFPDMLSALAEEHCSVYLLGGEPGVPEAAMSKLNQMVPHHSVIEAHHGFILKDPQLENAVIARINACQPDILIVGFGTPLQEQWIAQNRHRLKVSTIYAIGAVMDFMSGKVSRCPRWMGDAGLEWLYRLGTEPKRLLGRYVVGNPWFLSRILLQAALQKIMHRSPSGITTQKPASPVNLNP